MREAGIEGHAPSEMPKETRSAIRLAAVISLLAAIVASISLFPTALFAIRFLQYRRQVGSAPSTPLSLLAALAMIPFVLGLALLFAV